MKTRTIIKAREFSLRGYVLGFADEEGKLCWITSSSGAFLIYQSRSAARKVRQRLLMSAKVGVRITVRWIAASGTVTPE